MKHYEIVLLLHPEHRDLIPGILNHLKDIVVQSGGSIHRFEEIGLRPLAYPINKLTKAYYVLMNIEIGLEALSALKEQFKYQETIFRDLILSMPSAVTTPSILLRTKNEKVYSSSTGPKNTFQRSEQFIESAADNKE